MAGELSGLIEALIAPNALILLAAVVADLAIGDPVYPFHPVRLIGRTLVAFEGGLRRIGAEGYGGGIALFVMLAMFWLAVLAGIVALCLLTTPWAALAFHFLLLYSLLALGDLAAHVLRVERALQKGELEGARRAIAHLVGRDTAPMDGPACRRAGIESLSENLTDGFLSPLLWYAVFGLAGLVLFKVVSTMDSMVGNKTPRYLKFGRCGARLDDVLNYIPARASLPLIALVALFVAGCSAAKAWRIGLAQHAVLPSPNSGWSESATAGAIQRRLVGPIWMRGALVTDVWLGDASDPPAATHEDVVRALILVLAAGIFSALLTSGVLLLLR